MSRLRRFLREVAERIGLVPFNPISIWDSDHRQRERQRRRRNY